MTEPPSLARLCDDFIEAMEPARKLQLLSEIARTPAATQTDAAKALEIFARYPGEEERGAIYSAIELADPRNSTLEPAFVAMIKSEEPEAMLLGMRGAARLRASSARPLIIKIAKRKFKQRKPSDLAFASERNAWLAQYEALNAIARIDGESAFDLVKSRTRQTPLAARILALAYWEKTLPLLVEWYRGSPEDRERADEALAVNVPTPALRATREPMLAVVRDAQAPRELRHQLALKVGLVSEEPEVVQLVAEHDKASDESVKLMLAAAIFSSRTRAAVPLLTRYVKENPDPRLRAGARAQLRDTLPLSDYRPLLDWAAQNDPDPAARAAAAKELKGLPVP